MTDNMTDVIWAVGSNSLDRYWYDFPVTTSEKYTRSDKVDILLEALEIIAKRPDLPNPERDADWKNCMKWSSHEAREALSKFKEGK